jgi:hypothetical protein
MAVFKDFPKISAPAIVFNRHEAVAGTLKTRPGHESPERFFLLGTLAAAHTRSRSSGFEFRT